MKLNFITDGRIIQLYYRDKDFLLLKSFTVRFLKI